VLSSILALTLACPVTRARADGPATDALRDVGVATRDGATFRGELVERVPGDHLTVKLASGEIKRFAWADIADVATSKDKDKPDAPDAKPPTVHVAVDGEAGVLLERRQTAAEGWTATVWPGYSYVETWEVVCVAPCKTVVDAASTYRVNGGGVTTSRNFSLPQGREALRLHLVPHSALLHGAGLVMMLSGALVGLAGGSGLIAAPVQSDGAVESTLRGLGVVGVVVGVATLAAGIPVWLMTYSTARTDDGKTLGATRPLIAF
jgi:hypothetical protein